MTAVLLAGPSKACNSDRAGLLSFGVASPLLSTEETADYDELMAQITLAVQPADAVERIWVRDFAYYHWEAMRLRWLKTKYLNEAIRLELSARLTVLLCRADRSAAPMSGDLNERFYSVEGGALADDWLTGDQHARRKVQETLVGLI
jgi:hypothetical protein